MPDAYRQGRWFVAAAAALIAAGLACGPGPGTTAKNPPTLTPTTAGATQAPVPAGPTTFQMPDTPAASALKVGEQAAIHTTAGDRLRIHSRPSFDAPVTDKLEDGTLVTIIAGPQLVGADRWWQIETADGKSGWAVESAEGIQTLQAVP